MINPALVAILTSQSFGSPFTLFILAEDTFPYIYLAESWKCPILAKMIITKERPSTINDLQFVGDKVSQLVKEFVLSWASSKHPMVSEITNWQYAQYTWDINNDCNLFNKC